MQKAKTLFSLILCTLTLLIQFGAASFLAPVPAQAESLWDRQIGVKSSANDSGQLAVPFNESTKPTDIRIMIARIIKVFLSFIGTIFLILMVYAGFRWMTAGGNEKNVDEAKALIRNAAIGLVIILMAYAVTAYLTDCVFDISSNSTWMCI